MKSFIGFTCEDRFIGQGCKPDDAGGDDGEITPDIPPEIVANGAFWDFRTQSEEFYSGADPTVFGQPEVTESGVSFDGVDDGISFYGGRQSMPGLGNAAGDFTLEFFDLSLADKAGSIFGNDASGSTPRGFHIYYRLSPSRLIIVSQCDNLAQQTVESVPVNTPIHLAIERHGTAFRAYINGAVVATWTQTGVLRNPFRPWYFGRRGQTDFMEMSLAACRVTASALYKGAFTPPEIPDITPVEPAAIGRDLVEGVRTWFNGPSMIRDGGKVLFSAVGPSSVNLHAWDLLTGETTTPHVMTTQAGDDHNDGGLAKLASGQYVLGAVAHNAASFQMARGLAPDEMTNYNIGTQLNAGSHSYANLYELEGDALYLFGRGGIPWSARYSRSEDGGATWEPYTIWAEDGTRRPYVQYCKTSPTRLDFILTDGHPDDVANNCVYHGYVEGNVFHKTDGTPLTIPVKPSDFTKIHDGAVNGKAWVNDLQLIEGKLVASYVSYPNGYNAHRYNRAILDAGFWAAEVIVSNSGGYLYIGSASYSGNFCQHPGRLDTVFACISDFGPHQLYKLTKTGDAWSEQQLTQGPRCFRPKVCDGALTFLRGDYVSYTSYAGVKVRGVRL